MNKYLTYVIAVFLVTSLANASPKADLMGKESANCGNVVVTQKTKPAKTDETTHPFQQECEDISTIEPQNLMEKNHQAFLQREMIRAMIEPVNFTY